MIDKLKKDFKCKVGYSGHENGIAVSICAAILGASSIERHITLDRTMYGSDQVASIENANLVVSGVRAIEKMVGTGVKEVFEISQGSGVEAGFISVPDLVRVSFMNGSGPADYLPQFKMCAITQVDINYTPDGSYAKIVDVEGNVGGVVAMELTVGFQETKLVYREEVENF